MDVEEAAFSEKFVVEEASDNESKLSLKDQILEKLDQVEAQVENLRKSAAQLENKKDHILTSLHALKNLDSLNDFNQSDKDDIFRFLERVTRRCTTVDIFVHIDRSEEQVDSLHQVNCLIDNLIIGMRDSPDSTRARCLSYVSACSSSYIEAEIDKSFESAVLGCALDDQKRIRQRLTGLLDYMTKEKWKQDIQPMD